MTRLLFVLCAMLMWATPAYGERSDRDRAVHAAGIVTFGGLYLAIEFPLNSRFYARTCRWCDPTEFDLSVRDALKWDNTDRAATASDVLGFGGTAAVLSGMLVVGAGDDRSVRRAFDDIAPIVESAILGGLLQSAIKYTVRRQRPFARYAPPDRLVDYDDHHSFWSGHTASVFAEAVAAGLVARERGYELEPAIWATGLTLAFTTGYLRIAADKHYATDVLIGAAMGSACGALVARLHRGALRQPTRAEKVARAILTGTTF